MELRQFRYFIAVAEERHFGRAADRLGIAQPGLSHQVKALEDSLGVQLLERHSRGAELTAAGSAFLDQARLAVEFADRAIESAGLPERGKTSLLKVGTRAAGLPPVAERLLAEFASRHPMTEVEVHPGYAPQVLEALEKHTIDVAILLRPFASAASPHFLRLGELEPLVALPSGHRLARRERVSIGQLLEEPFLDWPRAANPALYDHIHGLLFGPSGHPQLVPVAEVVESRRLPRVAAGNGFAVVLLPPTPAEKVDGVVLRPFEEPVPRIEYGIIWFDSHVSAEVPAFVALAAEIAELPVGSEQEARLLA